MAQLIKDKKNAKKRHLLYNLFNPTGNGKGTDKNEAKKPKNIKYFFVSFYRNFNMMFALNIFAMLGNFPIFFGLYALTGNLNHNVKSPSSCLFAPIYGASKIGGQSPVVSALLGVHGIQSNSSFFTTATKVFFLLTLLVIFTWGIVNVAIAYVMRNLVKGDPTTFLSDVRYSIKRNKGQAVLFGIIDVLLIFVIAYDLLIFYLGSSANTLYSVLFGVMIVIALTYAIMRYYIYVMMVTFDLSIFKLIKNALIFSIIGFKRNVPTLIGMAITGFLEYMLLVSVLPIGIIFPIFLMISIINYMGVYAAYPKIKEIMIDPYYVSDSVGAMTHEEAEKAAPVEEEKPVFTDRG